MAQSTGRTTGKTTAAATQEQSSPAATGWKVAAIADRYHVAGIQGCAGAHLELAISMLDLQAAPARLGGKRNKEKPPHTCYMYVLHSYYRSVFPTHCFYGRAR